MIAIIVLLPFVAAAQNGISKKQSRQRLDALQRLEKSYNICAYADDTIHTDTIPAVGTAIDEEEIDDVFVFVENEAEFPGGDSALYMFICMNLSYPVQARENGLEGQVTVSFVVKKDGTIDNVKILQDIGGGCGQAVVEMVKSMPPWKPATLSGKPVNCEFILPVIFRLTDDEPDGTLEEKCLFKYNSSSWKK